MSAVYSEPAPVKPFPGTEAALPSGQTGLQPVTLVGVCLLAGAAAGLLTAGVSPVAGFAGLAGLAGLAVLLTNPGAGLILFVLVVYLLPFGVIPVPIGGVKLTILDAILAAMLLLWMLRHLVDSGEPFVSTPALAGLGLFLGIAVAAFVLGSTSVTPEIFRFFLKAINALLLYVTLTNLVQTPPQLRRLVLVALVAAAAAAAIAIGLYLLAPATASQFLNALRVLGYPSGSGVLRYIAGTNTLRAIGTAVDPNVLGGMLVLAVPLAASQALGERPAVPRRLAAGFAGAMALALMLTFSRGSWAGAAAGLLFLGTIRYRRLWLFFGLLVIAMVVLPQGEAITERIESGVLVQDRAAAMRVGEYRDALRLIVQYPWLGVGFGQAPDIDLYIASSSVFLMVAEQTGLIGLAAFLLTVGLVVVPGLRALRSSAQPALSSMHAGLLAGLVGALVAGLFDHYFFNIMFPHMLALFWAWMGMVAVSSRLQRLEARH